MPYMDRIFSIDSFTERKGSVTLHKMMKENWHKPENVPDLTDFMNDMFFGTVDKNKKAYNLTGGGGRLMDEEVDFDDSTRINSSRLTQDWLEEAKRMVASSPSRCESPSRLVGSPRFAAAQARLSVSSLDRRDPLSRSARRHRPLEGFGEEILKKSNHTRNKSASIDTSTSPSLEQSPAAVVHKWFSNILTKTTNPTSTPHSPTSHSQDPTVLYVPPRQSTHRRSRFQTETTPAPQPQSQGIPILARRNFRTTPPPTLSEPTTQVLSPPKNLMMETAHRRSLASSKYSSHLIQPLSPPKKLVESAHKRSISKSTCSTDQKVSPKNSANANGWSQEGDGTRDIGLNDFLIQQRNMIDKISYGEFDSKAKIVLPAHSNSTSSMVAAISYAWLLENRMRKKKGQGAHRDRYVVVPVMNVRRGNMWKHRQAAWLFHHVGLDTTSLLFADEVDLETLMITGKLNIFVVGQDVLRTNAEVGSQCTILTDNYCEEAYDLLQTPMLKKLLLAGILLDTQNLDSCSSLSMTRDAKAVQLLFVGSDADYRNNLFDNLMQDQNDSSFLEALRHNYGEPLNEDCQGAGAQLENRGPPPPQRKSNSISHEIITKNLHKDSNNSGIAKGNEILTNSAKPNSSPAQVTAPTRAAPDTSGGKNKFFLAKWFGFGSK